MTADLKGILRGIEELSGQDKLRELTRRIYLTIPKMFEENFEPRGIEVYHKNGSKKIYAWDLAENIARRILGLKVEKGRGNSWKDAQKRDKYT